MATAPQPRRKISLGFAEAELHNFLDEIEKYKPIGQEEWQLVESAHSFCSAQCTIERLFVA